ncbi:MAG: hypothetical protein WDN50_07320 [Bradyrhizobium sp.]
MPNRTAKFVSALFASLLAGAPLTTVTHGATTVADDCLSGPKGQAPQGAHWYYRVDRSTKRHCWYLADQQHTPRSQTAAVNPTSAKPQDADAALQQSVANAHAELPADATRAENSDNVATQLAQGSLVASRWPDPYSSASEAAPSPTKRDPGTGATSASQNQPTSVLAAGQFATADASSGTSLYSLPLQLAALASVFALAGIIGTVMFKFGRSPQLQPSEISNRRGHVWESTDDDRIVLSRHPGTNGFARGRYRTTDRRDRTAEFFAQISRRAPT